MTRPNLAVILILAFLNLLLAPVRATWACPDGSACVEQRGNGFVCAQGRRMRHGSCCEAKKQIHCKHGSFPVIHHAAATTPAVSEGDSCRYVVQGKPQLTAVVKQAGALWVSFDALPPPTPAQFVLPDSPLLYGVERTAGHSPPDLFPTGPSRAPPTA